MTDLTTDQTNLSDRDWDMLLKLIKGGKCTPVIGAGACAGTLPLGSEIAQKWAEEHGYPLADKTDLARVAQFMAIDSYDMYPKDEIGRVFGGVSAPDFSAPGEPHGMLADLQLPIYITTNYDDFMVKALESRGLQPQREFCRWNDFADEVMGHKSLFDNGYIPTPSSPLVFHLHEHLDIPQSMVLTEGDYLDFLIRLSQDHQLLPSPIRQALAGTSLLFVGYSLRDWNFRVLLRGLVGSLGASLGYLGIAVQLPPHDLSREMRLRAQHYLDRYFEQLQRIKVRIYWGDGQEFARELRSRWEAMS